jgi:hypothetical protein
MDWDVGDDNSAMVLSSFHCSMILRHFLRVFEMVVEYRIVLMTFYIMAGSAAT